MLLYLIQHGEKALPDAPPQASNFRAAHSLTEATPKKTGSLLDSNVGNRSGSTVWEEKLAKARFDL